MCKKEITTLCELVILFGHLKVYKMSSDRKEHEPLKGLLNGNYIYTLDKKIILDRVAQQTLSDLGDSNLVYVLHDPCDIRKPYSTDLEHLGKVLLLQKKPVDGYCSFNSAAILPQNRRYTY